MRRYPGPDPFTSEYKHVFFGREDEQDNLLSLIAVNRLTVVFGRSGTGKSSLLNAGIVPMMENEYHIVMLRFKSESERKIAGNTAEPSPKETFIEKITQHSKEDYFLQEGRLSDSQKFNMWYAVKNLQKKNKNVQTESTEDATAKKGLLLIMDQFEEVFTYSASEIHDFGVGLAEVVNNRMPDHIQRRLYKLVEKQITSRRITRSDGSEDIINGPIESPSVSSSLETDLELVEDESLFKIVIGIRSDKLSKLESYSSLISGIFRNMFEITQLTTEKAIKAIREPALMNITESMKAAGIAFDSVKFAYQDQAVAKICSYMQSQADQTDDRVEAFQLQMICHRIEDMVIEDKFEEKLEELTLVTHDQLPALDDIVKNYYRNVLFIRDENGTPLFDKADRLFIRYLIERKLINRRTRTRLSIDQALIEPIGISEKMLDLLIRKRLIRIEPNTVRGFSYEICHDTMVDSLLNADADRKLGNLSDKLQEYYLEQIELSHDGSKREMQKNELAKHIHENFLSPELDPVSKPELFASSEAKEMNSKLTKRRILREFGKPQGPRFLEPYEAFLSPIKVFKQQVDDSAMKSGRRRLATLIFSLVIASVVIFGLIAIITKLKKEGNKSHALVLLNNVNDIKDHGIALRVLQHAYKMYPDTIISAKITDRYAMGGFSDGLARTISLGKDKCQAYLCSDNSKYLMAICDPPIVRQRFASSDTTLYGMGSQAIDSEDRIPNQSFFKLRLFKLPGDSIAMLDSVVNAAFIGSGDSIIALRKKRNQYLVEIVDLMTSQKTVTYLPVNQKGILPANANIRASLSPTIFYDSKNKLIVVSCDIAQYPEIDNSVKYYSPILVHSAGKGWVNLNKDNSRTVSVRQGDSPLFVLRRSLDPVKPADFFLLDALGREKKLNLPSRTNYAKFRENSDTLIGFTDSFFYFTDIKNDLIISSSPDHSLMFVDYIGDYWVSRNTNSNYLSGKLYFWQFRRNKLILTDSFVSKPLESLYAFTSGRSSQHLFISKVRIEKRADSIYAEGDSLNIVKQTSVYIWSPKQQKAKEIFNDSTGRNLFPVYCGVDHLIGLKSYDMNANYEILADINGILRDKFVFNNNQYNNGVLVTTDSKWIISRLDWTTLRIFDFPNKTSAFDIKAILAGLEKQNPTIPKLTPAQEKQYETKSESVIGFFLKKDAK